MLVGSFTAVAAPPAVVLKPLPGGALPVAVVCPRYTGLDVEALAARMDLDLRVVHTWERAHLGFDAEITPDGPEEYTQEAVAGKLGELLGKKPPKVVVLANIDAAALPESFQVALRQFVEQGGGLAMAYVGLPEKGPLRELADAAQALEEDPGLKRGVPEAYAPDGTTLAEAAYPATFGSGRVVTFSYSGDVPQHHALFPPPAPGIDPDPHHEDHACLLWARTLLWLAGRIPERTVTALDNVSPDGPSDVETPPDLPDEFVQSMRDTVVAQMMRPFALTLNEASEREYRIEMRVRPQFQAGPGYRTEGVFRKGNILMGLQLMTGPGSFFVDASLLHKDEVVDWYSQRFTIPGWPEFESIRADKTFLQANDRLVIEAQMRPVYSVHRSATVYAQAVDSYGRLTAQAWQPIDHSGGRVLLNLTFADLTAPLVEVRILALEGEPHTVSPWDFYAGAVETLRFPVRFSRRDEGMNWITPMDSLMESNTATYLSRLSALGVTHVAAPGGRPALVSAARQGALLVPVVADYRPQTVVDGNVRFPSFADSGYATREDERLRDEVLDYYAGGSGAYLLGDPVWLADGDQNVCQGSESIEAFRAWSGQRGLELPDDDDALGLAIAPAADQGSEHGAHFADFRTFMDGQLAGFLGKRKQTLLQVHPDAEVGIGAARDENLYHGYDWHMLATDLDYIGAEWDALAYFKLASYLPSSGLSGLKVTPGADAGAMVWLAAAARFGSVWTPSPIAGALAGAESGWLAEDGQATEAALVFAAEFKRCNDTLGPLLRAAEPVAASVGILDAPRSRYASTAAATAYPQAQLAWARQVAKLGHWPRFTHVSELSTAYAKGLRAVAWAEGTMLDSSETQALAAFVQAGGVVIATTAGCEACRAAAGADVVLCPEPAGLDASLREKNILPPLPLDEKSLAANGGVQGLVRAFRYGDAELYLSIPWPGEGVEKLARTGLAFGKDESAYLPLDTDGTSKVRSVKLNAAAPDCAVRLGYQAKKLELETPKSIAAGTRLDALCTLKTDSLTPGKHLLMLTLSPIGGQPIAGGSRWVSCDRGIAKSYVPVPLNAIPGDYTLRARDLLTGLETQKMVEIIAPGGPGFQSLH
jgi:hypothetical protein